MELLESEVVGRRTRSSQRIANLKTSSLEISLIKSEDASQHNYDRPDECDDTDSEMTGMFVNVDVEVDANADLLFADENGTSEGQKSDFDTNWESHEERSSSEPTVMEGGFKAKGIIAKLAEKLNSKLNSVMVPRPTDDLLACLEPEVSVATEGTITSGGVYVCPWCPLTSMNPKSLEEHKRLCHSVTSDAVSDPDEQREAFSHPHTCEECGQTFAKSWNLKRHYYLHTGERPFICVDCGERFSCAGDLSVHRRCNHAIQSQRNKNSKIQLQNVTGAPSSPRWLCYVCPQEFSSKSSLQEHQRGHSKDTNRSMKLKCQLCANIYETSDELNEHMRVAHTSCPVCDKPFSNLAFLKKGHMLTQHRLSYCEDSGLFICLQCKKEMTVDSQLKEHSCLLAGLRPFKCKDCGDSFRGSNDLKVHMRIHTGERPFICPECGETFTQRGNLTVHIRTHTGEKPFECRICGRCFMKSSNLKEHIKVHKEYRGHGSENDSSCSPIQALNQADMWDKTMCKKVSEMAKDSHDFRTAIAGKLVETGFVPPKKEDPVNFRDTIAERLKETGVLSFGNGNVSLRLL